MKLIKGSERTTTVGSYGEILGDEYKNKSLVFDYAFGKLYHNNIDYLFNLHDLAIKLFLALQKYVDYDNKLILDKTRRSEIAERLSVNKNSLKKRYKELINNGFIFDIDEKTKILNPHLFARGDMSVIKAHQDMIVDYGGKYVMINTLPKEIQDQIISHQKNRYKTRSVINKEKDDKTRHYSKNKKYGGTPSKQ